ncbi:Transcriptional regulator, TetR family, partial [Pseudomonas savastanoi]
RSASACHFWTLCVRSRLDVACVETVMFVTNPQQCHLLSTYSNVSKLRPMSKNISNPAAGRGPVDHEIRDQIVIAATEHFSQYGYGKTTVSDLARAIGFSKAYIYKFFESKQAIGEMICAHCLSEIEAEVSAAISQTDQPPEKLRRMFKSVVEASIRLFSQDRKLYEIATSAATERWQATLVYEEHLKATLRDILQEGRQTGDFERKTPLDETVMAIYLVMRPYINPLLLQYSFEHTDEGPSQLSSLVLRSLSP